MSQPADILFAADDNTTLQIEWQSEPPVFPSHVQDYLDQRWHDYESTARICGGMLFNGPVTLYRGHRVDGNTLTLSLCAGDFKTHIVTAVRDRAWFHQHAPECIFPGLGNSVLLTSGAQVILGMRSAEVASHPNKAHVFGGVADLLGTTELPATPEGLIQHLQIELTEELKLASHDMIGAPKLLGLFRDPLLSQPEIVWHWETRLDVKVIRSRIIHQEHTGLVTLSFFHAASESQCAEACRHLTPLAQTAWKMA